MPETKVEITHEKKEGEKEPEKKIAEDKTTEQAVSNEQGAPVVKHHEHKEHIEK